MTSPKLLLIGAAALALGACTDGGTAPASRPTTSAPSPMATTTASRTDTDPLPLLQPGTPLGVAGFAPPSPGHESAWRERWDEVQASAPIGRVMIDWIEVEPEEGQYEFDELEESLDEVSGRSQAPMLTLVATDVSGTPFPEWLGGFEPERAAEAYNRMLDELAPILDEHDVWYLAVANEPPLEDGLDRGDFAAFVATIRDHSATLVPDMAVGFVFAGGDIYGDDPGTAALHEASDVLALNHYCLGADLSATPLSELDAGIDRILDVADGRPVIFQEFGCPASTEIGSSDDFQAEWFARAFARIAAEPDVRAAFVFEFHDWPVELVEDGYAGLLDEPGLEQLYGNLSEWLTTTGLVRGDLTPRPSFDVFIEAAARSDR